MAEESYRPRLGRGLAALIGDVGDESDTAGRSRGQRRIPIEFLKPNPRNPRKQFGDDDLDDLSSSIREKGVLQPILVRAIPGLADAFEIIAGERRWRASQRAGLHDVPVVVVEANDREAMEIAIVENVQRADLNAMEEASGYDRLISEHGYTQNDLAKVIGKSRSHVANTLRLLKLPAAVRASVEDGSLSAGHARALLAVNDPEKIAKRAIADGLTVRDVERIAQKGLEPAPEQKGRSKPPKDPDTLAVEKALEEVLGLHVSIEHRGESGEVRIKYKTLEQLDGLCRRLKS
ncbi:MAG: chromosome partitioning protein ParB [Rhizobiales bacterium 65-9]|nr:ParB/RepB/Spo0J family partition protein [Hyphomicrobiales bacterium]OJY34593.1 MAG: chromosome partitioning protein ParB [Rhizobiales bacterium 65-9]